jgi:hypothetical protein
VRNHYVKEPERVLVELLHNRVLGPELKGAVSKAKYMTVTWVCLEDYLREQQSRTESLLSQTLKREPPQSDEQMLIYYWKVALILDAPEGLGMVGDSLTPDQLEMLLSLLPKVEVNHWRMSQLNMTLGDLPAAFCRFVKERIGELRQCISTPGGSKEPPQTPTQSREGTAWEGPCVLGDLCGKNLCRRGYFLLPHRE